MITELVAKNFKSWQSVELALAPLTGFFGANSSGKTSLLQMLLLLKQTVETSDRNRMLHFGDDRSLVDLGTFYDVVFNHRTENALSISVSWKLPQQLIIKDPEKQQLPLYEIDVLSFFTQVDEVMSSVSVDFFHYTFDTHVRSGMYVFAPYKSKFGMKRTPKKRSQYELEAEGYKPIRIRGRAWPLPPPVKCYGFPNEAIGYYQNTGFLSEFVLAFENLFSRMTYLGPLREYPRRSYIWAGERPQDVGQRGGKAIAALLAARAAGLKSPRLVRKKRLHKPIEERILEWLQKMELIHSFSLQPIAKNRKDYELRVKKSVNSSDVLITDVGFGVSQILPVLVLCYYAPEHSTIILEQPEIHLHPKVQADLADVFIDVVKERNVQIILESHSEHLLRRLQRRIAEEQIDAKMTALYFCRIEDGISKAERLDVDDYGNIRNWPQGFFGDEMEELAAMTTAQMERRKAKNA
jgi:predicted ATPase